MTTTWKVLTAVITDEKKIVTIQEVIDGVEGKIYREFVHKTDSDNSIRVKLKTKINLDRGVITENEAFKAKVETALENFEDFLNT